MHRRIFGMLMLASLVGCGAKQPVTAPDFELQDLDGKTVTLSSLKGHPVLLDFWATWCGPCRMSIPLVQKFYQAHKQDGLMVLGLNTDEDRSGVYSFVKHFGMTYPVLYAGNGPVAESYGVEGIPTFIFIDKAGRITRRFEGFGLSMADAWEAELQRQLNSPQ
jgi:cytochrome c biogenesis protein CcmG/thiol:disulfide interchange protein DsbE